MPNINFLGQTYQSRSSNIDDSRCVNFYPELNQSDSKSIIALIGTPGSVLFAQVGNTPIRGAHVFNGVMFIVLGNSLCSVNPQGTLSASLGTLQTSTGRVSMSDNGLSVSGVGGNQLIIVDGTTGYIYNIGAATPYLAPSFTTISGYAPVWTTQLIALTYISGTKFSVSGNATSLFSTGTLVQAIVTAGLITGQVTTSVYTAGPPAITTVTVSWTAGQQLDNGLSSIAIGVTIGGGWPLSPSQVCFIDGYFVVSSLNSMSYHVSDLYNGLIWRPLAMSPVSSSPDSIQTLFQLQQQLWIIKNYTSEVWYDTGTPTSQGSPFSRISGGVLDFGTSAPWSWARGDNSYFGLANQRNNDSGELIGIVELSGSVAKTISTPAISYKISQMGYVSDAFGYCYSEEGHTFYVLTFPYGNWTIVYDATTGMFHERSTYTGSPYAIGRHFGNCYCYFNGKHYLGDISGNIYEMNSSYYTDGSFPIVSIRQAQHIFDRTELRNFSIRKLEVDMEGGTLCLAKTSTPPASSLLNSLVHFDGAGGSTNIIDVYGHNWVCINNAQLSTMNPKFGTACLTSDGNSRIGTNDFTSLGGKFTLECWVNWINVTTPGQVGIFNIVNGAGKGISLAYYTGASRQLSLSISSNGTSWNIANSVNGTYTGWTNGTWYKIVVDYDGSVYRVFYGTSGALTFDISVTSSANVCPFVGLFAGQILGYLDELRITMGSNRYGASAIAETSAFTIDTLYPPVPIIPQAALSWSSDGGHQWSNEYWASVGQTGQYKTRLVWRRLGYARDRIFRVAISDPVKKVMIGAFLE